MGFGFAKRLTYANVVSTLALFLVLTGGAAYAHRYLTRKSVGSPQLKANAVTTAKIKANAVTTRKIKRIAVSTGKLKEGAVTTEKLFDGAVTGAKIDAETVPFGRVVHRASGSAQVSLETGAGEYPLQGAVYTQAPRETDSFVGALDVSFSATCKQPRKARAFVLLDQPSPIGEMPEDRVAEGTVEDDGTGGASRRIELSGSNLVAPTRFEPGSTTAHRLYLFAESECATGGGVTADFGGVDVIGVE
jgi:methionine-rich copper-binding protein CopC